MRGCLPGVPSSSPSIQSMLRICGAAVYPPFFCLFVVFESVGFAP